ncbi:YgjV family protein [Aquimarina algicola]|uniref:Uroporphyrinogen decarboxylase n=1 Tax=Aquimarina algicola TaxID=2589995 RepID=A0A504J8K8_9FLAO|nr:YgjV family protein [Aquimarina algicola]TPN83389.1 hypothetical protein FHK87_19400 [Aquimarina algicola]
MDQINWIETLGYIASFFIAMSITMSSILKLRIVNLIGAFLLGTYGILINSIPIVLLNYFIVLTNIYFIYKILKEKKS